MSENLIQQWEQAAQRHLEVARLVFDGGYYGQAMASCYFAMLAAATALLVKEGLEVRTHPGVHTYTSPWIVGLKSSGRTLWVIGHNR